MNFTELLTRQWENQKKKDVQTTWHNEYSLFLKCMIKKKHESNFENVLFCNIYSSESVKSSVNLLHLWLCGCVLISFDSQFWKKSLQTIPHVSSHFDSKDCSTLIVVVHTSSSSLTLPAREAQTRAKNDQCITKSSRTVRCITDGKACMCSLDVIPYNTTNCAILPLTAWRRTQDDASLLTGSSSYHLTEYRRSSKCQILALALKPSPRIARAVPSEGLG